jgi:anti-anti-sigma regulatory factor
MVIVYNQFHIVKYQPKEIAMEIQKISDSVGRVDLPREPELRGSIVILREQEETCHLLLGFERVDIITSDSLTQLLFLQKKLAESGRRVVLVGVTSPIRGNFAAYGVYNLFLFAEDQDSAIKMLVG